MGWYPTFLMSSALLGAICAGFILAQSPRVRATQLSALLAAAAAWWAFCEGQWNAAANAEGALRWMRLSAPGWAFVGGLLPHLMLRYLDSYSRRLARTRRWLAGAAGWGYLAGAAVCTCSWLGRGVHGDPIAVSWGWAYLPGPAMRAFLSALGPPLGVAFVGIRSTLRSRESVAPRVHRLAIVAAILVPLVLAGVTDIGLPLAGVIFPRFGSVAYSFFGLLVLAMGMRYGLSFFTPRQFSSEILDTLHEGVVMISPQGSIRRANRGFARLSGRRPEDLVGSELAQVLEWEAPLAPGLIEDTRGELYDGAGTPIPVSVSSAPLCDDAGNRIGLVVVVRDLREIEDLRLQMVTQARLAAVGEMAAGLAHEINNPLAFVRSNLGQLERSWKSLWDESSLSHEERTAVVEESREIIGETVEGVDRASEIVRGVRRFVHSGSPTRELSDLNELLDDAISMLRPQLQRAAIELELNLGALPVVRCAPQELRQVFLNLLVNAIHALQGSGQLSVATRHCRDEVVVEVVDDGHGIPPEAIERIFDPFYTTKAVGEGTGLGLPIAWQIVDSHGGRIAVESTPGRGSTFRVHLPLAELDGQEA